MEFLLDAMELRPLLRVKRYQKELRNGGMIDICSSMKGRCRTRRRIRTSEATVRRAATRLCPATSPSVWATFNRARTTYYRENQIMTEEGGTKGSNPIRPFLMFSGECHGQAQAAIHFYTSIFPASRIISIEKYGPKQAEPEGTVRSASFVLNGQDFMAIDSAAPHAFNFTPSLSLRRAKIPSLPIETMWYAALSTDTNH
jgi:predicted 3-demethylubiquinone-9 3-methyltransferase (glyoxalase superfamily)